jgi:hypothetical protein
MSDLSSEIDAARADVHRRADGQLIRGRRQAILRALGDADAGRAARARLAHTTVTHVLPLWLSQRPGDDGPQKALALIDGALDGSIDEQQVRAAAGDLWAHTDNLIVTTGPEPPLHVGYAASRALMTAARDEPFDPPDADPARTDQGRAPNRLDTAYLASTAAAEGAPGVSGDDAGRRREFWEWWLDQAAAASSSPG